MDPREKEPPPRLKQEGELSSYSLPPSTFSSPFDSAIDQNPISEGYVGQTAAHSVWQSQPKTDLDSQPCQSFHNTWPYLPTLPRLNEETHTLPPLQGAPNTFHEAPSHQLQPVGVYQPSSQYFVEQQQYMYPEPSPEIPPPIYPSVGSDPYRQTNLTPRWYNAFPHTESNAFRPTASVLGNTEQYPANSLHTQHQTSYQEASATSDSLPTQRPRRGRPPGSKNSQKDPAVDKYKFRCTFCCDSFEHKSSWSRHEESRHLSLGGWKCTPHGPLTVSNVDGTLACSYCGLPNPAEEHFQEHEGPNFPRCNKEQIFTRKDNLVHHLRRAHKVKTAPRWGVQSPIITSRCGFCDAHLASWDQRKEHLTVHFHDGKTMWDWEGGHGFAPEIAAQVTRAIPPYTIAAKSAAMGNRQRSMQQMYPGY
ncbi:unnamed protein product [Clonostachys byssicola]|uniref:C2H2-type domain-containing protein n=1 Tax=Clonostachys byssicola TaxID=160290 RepID=A0A9N9XZU0_9HYPO|nr:unnamed protein product [Clonostachys byssicola]